MGAGGEGVAHEGGVVGGGGAVAQGLHVLEADAGLEAPVEGDVEDRPRR